MINDVRSVVETTAGTTLIRVSREHHISEARRVAKSLAESLGFRQISAYYVVISVSELANNLYFHAHQGGSITLATVSRDGEHGIEIISEDDGPGIADISLALQDGFSTNGGLGGGLPGITRLMDEFVISSEVGHGTRIVTRKWKQ